MVMFMVTKSSRLPRMMSAAEFKAKCLQAMEQVAATGDPIIVTKRRKAIAQLAPVARKPKTLRGFLKGRVKTRKDIISPIKVPWDADRP
jgi:antitoxin (DNA-binding transcriptional repressor) of toxin-antitoxin stability system